MADVERTFPARALRNGEFRAEGTRIFASLSTEHYKKYVDLVREVHYVAILGLAGSSTS